MLNIDNIINFVLKNDLKYPGSHQFSSERTNKTAPILTPEAQLKLIWKEFNIYLENRLLNFESIKIPNFGTFIFTNNNLINTFSNKKFTESFNDFNSLYVAKLIFQIDFIYQSILKYFPDEKIKKKIMQPIEYFEPKKVINWNPYIISKKCFMNEIIVRDGINSIFQAIFDLVKCGKNLEFNLGFFKFKFNNRIVNYTKDNIFGL